MAEETTAVIVLKEPPAHFHPTMELAWICNYLCQKWNPPPGASIHNYPVWVAIPEYDKHFQQREFKER